MQLNLLKAGLHDFSQHLKTATDDEALFPYKSIAVFQNNWDLADPDLPGMIDRSLDNSYSRRLWSADHYAPKRMLLLFADHQPDFVRQAFKDLFNEGKSVGGRMDRFVFYCDELLQAHRQQNPLTPDNRHFHDDDYRMVSLYLAFRFPERYAYYVQADFLSALRALGVQDIPRGNDLERFVKVSRTLYNFIKKDRQLAEKHQQRLDGARHYAGESLWLVTEFLAFLRKNR